MSLDMILFWVMVYAMGAFTLSLFRGLFEHDDPSDEAVAWGGIAWPIYLLGFICMVGHRIGRIIAEKYEDHSA